MTDDVDIDGQAPFRPRIPPWVALLLIGPVVLAIVMYYVGVSTLNGVLLPEPRTLPAGTMSLPGGATASFSGRWSLLYVGQGDCNQACREALSRMREAHRALGEEMPRVQRFFVPTDETPPREFPATDDPDLVVLTDGMTSRDAVLATLGEFAEGDVFVADPRGSVVLRFPAGMAMQAMHEDLTLLLKASQTG